MAFLTNTVDDLLKSGVSFKEHHVHLNELKAVKTDKYKENRGAGNISNLLNTSIEFNGNLYTPTQRFWTSFCAKVGVGTNVFNLFNHSEVLNRVVDLSRFSSTGDVRIIEDSKNKRLLAITDPTKPVIDWQKMLQLIDRKGGYGVSYHDGIITSLHSLGNDLDVKIGNELHKHRICIHTPIDGYGSPAIYLALMRMVCSNGMVAMSKAFKTTVKIGKKDQSSDIEYSMERTYDAFSNDEGFDALIRRLDTARASALSVREYEHARRILARLAPATDKNGETLRCSAELTKFSGMAGNLHQKYGLSHLQQMTDKQMALLETDMTVYEAVNFMTEVATHRLNSFDPIHVKTARMIHGWVGSLVSTSYDLENTIDSEDVRDEFKGVYFN